jgi:3-oxoacyl-[acyl-carrier protein] reductase
MIATDQVAVITGASSGIGRAIAQQFYGSGWNVIVHGSRQVGGLAAEKATPAASPPDRLALVADFRCQEQLDELVRVAFARHRYVDCWINAAGADVLTGAARLGTFEEKLEALWQVDVRACMRLSRAAARAMQQQTVRPELPSIINLGWDQAILGMEGDSGQFFAACKGAVMAFSNSLAKSVGPRIRVNCVAPGWIQTAWGKAASEAWQRRARDESCLGRWGTPQDVAKMVFFLASPAASFISGQTIQVNGGWKSSSAFE